MASKFLSEVKSFLGPSEDVKVAMEATVIRGGMDLDSNAAQTSSDGKDGSVLAVITHASQHAGGEEEGRFVFLSKLK